MARNIVTAALLVGLLSSSGCCWWCEHWCPHPQPVVLQGGYAPGCGCQTASFAPGCGCPTSSYAPPGPQPNWTQPQMQPQTHTGCTCTCPNP
jgi:hypothetical protein